MDRNMNFGSDKKSKKENTSLSLETASTPKEGSLTKKVENVTARVTSLVYLGLAVGSILISASLAMVSEKKSLANFVGLWAPTILLLGIYNKVVKQDSKSEELHGAVH